MVVESRKEKEAPSITSTQAICHHHHHHHLYRNVPLCLTFLPIGGGILHGGFGDIRHEGMVGEHKLHRRVRAR